jgi:hypothetical protein
MRFATSGAQTLNTIDASDRGGDPKSAYVWPNYAKQAHNLATHLPAAMAEFGSRTALKQQRVQKGKQLESQQEEVQKQESQRQETPQQGDPQQHAQEPQQGEAQPQAGWRRGPLVHAAAVMCVWAMLG